MTATDRPGVVETHISTVMFTSDRAYKILKPIRTSFLDHRTVESRRTAVEDELVLNRRMAADVYLGTATVEEHGQVADHMLVMRRLPADRRLSELLRRRTDGDCLRRVARSIAVFHAAQRPLHDAHEIAGRDAVRANWSDNLRDIGLLDPTLLDVDLLDEVEVLAMAYLDHSESLFNMRLNDGQVRDGHGDLTAEDIFCLDDGPRIIDCLAFDSRLRIGDVLLDVAFLAMDAERLGGTETATELWRHYARFSGEHHPPSLASHYVAYRAGVRAKVSALRLQQGHPSARHLVDRYLRQARRHLLQAQRRVIVVGGTPGTGKSTTAMGLSDQLGYPVVRSDIVRKELVGRAQDNHTAADVDEDIYTPETTQATYAEMFRRADSLLARGSSVILDASFAREVQRKRARDMATVWGALLTEVQCTSTSTTTKQRVAARLEAGDDASDAHPTILGELRARFAPWPSAEEISTEESLQKAIDAAVAAITADENDAVPTRSGLWS